MIDKFRYIPIAAISAVIIALGFVRDSLFKYLNYRMYQLKTSSEEIIGSNYYQFLFENLDLEQLYTAKWVFTFLFVIIYYVLTSIGIWLIYQSKKYHQLILIIFSVIFILSGISYFIGSITGNLTLGYRFARILMGAIQSPFILLVLIPGIKILKNPKLVAGN